MIAGVGNAPGKHRGKADRPLAVDATRRIECGERIRGAVAASSPGPRRAHRRLVAGVGLTVGRELPVNRAGHQLAGSARISTAGPRRLVAAAASLIIVLVAIACWLFRGGGYPLESGRPFDASQAISLGECLTSQANISADRLVIRGRVGNVCRASGCWFVLQQVSDGRLHELFVDLKRQAALVVPPDAAGRSAVVTGKLVETGSSLVFEADGFRIE